MSTEQQEELFWEDRNSVLSLRRTIWSAGEQKAYAEYASAVDRSAARPDHVLSSAGGALEPLADLVETPSLRERALSQLVEAIMLLPDREKTDYLTALSICPDLVARESDPMRFLRIENYNSWNAAALLVKYWKTRREIFRERAFLPLNLTGYGALDEEDIMDIKCGDRVFLPNDSESRIVVGFDASRRLHHHRKTRLRSAFYIGNALSENKHSQTDGFVVIRIETSSPKCDEVAAEISKLFYEVFPIRVHSGHLVNCLPKRRRNMFSDTIIPFVGQIYKTLISRTGRMYVHNEATREDRFRKLQQFGFAKDSLPACLGGSWSYENHARWVKERMKTDIGGVAITPVPDVTTELIRDCTKLMDLAIEEIPPTVKAAYLKAVESAPELVRTESKFDEFLRAVDYHVTLATRRLADYWTLRSELFGRRVFKILSQTGEGALGRNDFTAISCGFCQLLPSDSSGRPVLFIDGSRLSDETEPESRDRVLFYMFSVASENEVSRRDGVVLVFRLGSDGFDKVNVTLLERLAFAMPLQVHSVHLICASRQPNDIGDMIMFGDRIIVFEGGSKDDLRRHLESFGLARRHLPLAVGGSWSYASFVYWQELRIRREWDLPVRKKAEIPEMHGLQPRMCCESGDERERKRRLTVIHSRRKRDRIRVDIDVLHENYAELIDEKETLQLEQKFLEKRLELAKAIVNEYEYFQGA